MNIAIYSSDLKKEKRNLLPWRTILEVSFWFKESGHNVTIYSGTKNAVSKTFHEKGLTIHELLKPSNNKRLSIFMDKCKNDQIDILFFPIDLRSVKLKILHTKDIKIIWYMPGAWYAIGQVLIAGIYMKPQYILPYLLQALTNKRRYIRKLTNSGIRPLITMTKYTYDKIISAGYPSYAVAYIPPGKEFECYSNEYPTLFQKWQSQLSENPYFLFFGPPQAIRGIKQIIAAFECVAKNYKTVRLVLLLRTENQHIPTKLRNKISRHKYGDRILYSVKPVNRSDLSAFLKNCFAVLKPFLIVPSEIPLSLIEAAGFGKPVIGTETGGTGEFINNFGITVPVGRYRFLAAAMIKLLENRRLYTEKCLSAKKIYSNHPNWSEVANQWLSLALKVKDD